MVVRIHVAPAAADVLADPEWWVLLGGRVVWRGTDRDIAIEQAVRMAQANLTQGKAAEVWIARPGGRSRRHWPAPDASSA